LGSLEQNTTLIYGIHIRESANDGSDFSNGASDYRVLFLGEDGALHLKDSAGSVTDVAAGSGSPGGDELDYAEFTAPVSITGTNVAGAQTIVTGNSVAYSGDILIEFYAPSAEVGQSVGAQIIFFLTDGGTDIGIIAQHRTGSTGSSFINEVHGRRKITGLAATKTYGVKAYRVTANGTVTAGAGGAAAYMPGYIRITDAS
jgi:hypothetical protein